MNFTDSSGELKPEFDMLKKCLFLMSILFLSACSSEQSEERRLIIEDFPVSYSGILPCADCPGIDYRLNLFADQSYYLQLHYQESGENSTFYQLGQWQQQTGQLRLLSDHPQQTAFQIERDGSISLLDQEYTIINSSLNYQLQRDAEFHAVYPAMQFNGKYSYMADSGIFKECLTGQRWFVAHEADNAALESLYMEYVDEVNQPILVELTGYMEPRANSDTGEMQPTLIVTQARDIWPGETCGELGYNENLINTYWKLTRLNDEPIEVYEQQREPSLILASEENRLSGSDGCNSIMGSFQLREDKLKFNRIASTMMACAQGMETAQAMHFMLEKVRYWKIEGQHLELADVNGNVMARFEAVHLQ
ncbi:Lipoprotein NlpE precursor [Methylophaga muralis]|uniref:Lipoprotein NlpE n=2 Tax=Methylophaga muralis TaxID=291169 RepID=A0A1E3GSQ7_9GAMM|nr:Lipoprotein NlpE precursor [Methylophaga muralis]